MPIDKARIPSATTLHTAGLTGADLEEAKQELDKASNGEDCHDAVSLMLSIDADQLPSGVPENTEPPWLRELLFCILAHRKYKGI